MTIVWDGGSPISGNGSLTLLGRYARLELSTIPTYVSSSSGPPVLYRNLGLAGPVAGTARLPGDVLIWATQIVGPLPSNADAIWYRLVNGVSGTIYRGADVTDTAIGARVRASAAQTLTTGVSTAVTFDLEDQDPWGMHSPTVNPSRITVPQPGWYDVGASLKFVYNATGVRGLKLIKNGTDTIDERIMPPTTDGTSLPKMGVNAVVYLAAGDYVELQAQQFSGGNLDTVVTAGTLPALWAVRVG